MLEQGLVTETKQGDGLVVCNLSSLCLHNIFTQDVDLQRVVNIQFRLLDNVISLNRTPVPMSKYTSEIYRPVGSGAMGLANLLAEKAIKWESDRASEYVDEIFEQIAYAQMTISHELAVERGAYPRFEGSDYHTGAFFDKRGYNDKKWNELRERIAKDGCRFGYHSSVAPTSSNSIIVNSFPSLDPPYEVVYQEEKAGMSVTIIPNNYSAKTKWYYKSGFEVDEVWSMKIISAAQRHVDQAISHNLHVHKSTKASDLLRIHNYAWENGVKTNYYVFSDIGDNNRSAGCVSCEG